ncbi:hypothetical protein GCM10010442_12890 [Kitasatospora kifunensis]
MTGGEQLTAWLVGIVCVTGAVSSIVKAWSTARVESAKAEAAAQEAVARAYLDAQRSMVEAQYGRLTIPETWSKGGGL